MTNSAKLRSRAGAEAQRLPPLLARAQHLASGIILGAHGRRRAGSGDEFWQFRPAHSGDPAHRIDWRRSARFDAHYIRETEWQAAQSVFFWCDRSQGMQFASAHELDTKADRSAILTLALADLLMRGGERVGLLAPNLPARNGEFQLAHMANQLDGLSETDFGVPQTTAIPARAHAVFFSDFLGDMDQITGALQHAVDAGVKGVLVQVLDPQEEEFPFRGRTIFETRGRSVTFETRKASALRDRYLVRLAERKDALELITRRAGWRYICHHTDQSAQKALLWLFGAMEHAS